MTMNKIAARIKTVGIPDRISDKWVSENFDIKDLQVTVPVIKTKNVDMRDLYSSQTYDTVDKVIEDTTESLKSQTQQLDIMSISVVDYSYITIKYQSGTRKLNNKELFQMIKEVARKMRKEQIEYEKFLKLKEKFGE